MKIRQLEAARGGAALYVMMHHAVPRGFELFGLPIAGLFRFGQEAVVVFFLLSGFVIAHSVLRKEFSGLAYLRARFLRIFVPFIPALALSYLVQSLINGGPVAPELPTLVGNLLMLQDFSFFPGNVVDTYMGNNPLWSLSYEWWFYMVFLLLMTRVPSWGMKTGIVTVLGLGAAALYPAWPVWGLRVAFSLSIWWTGVLAARAWSGRRLTGWRSLLPVAPLGAVAATLLLSEILAGGLRLGGFGESPMVEVRRLVMGGVLFLAALAWRAIGWRGPGRIADLLVAVAPISYGLYIVHKPLLTLGQHYADRIGALPAFILSIAASFLVAWLIERKLYLRVEAMTPRVAAARPSSSAA